VQRDLARARGLYAEAAALGDARAMYRLGLFNERGLAGPVDARAAADWYGRAAAAGYADGFAAIARIYIEGRVVAPDLALAETYIEKGIQAGSPAAMFLKAANLLDLASNPSAAMSLLLQAADLGNADAQELLSRLYQEGRVVPQDRNKAIEWARQAAGNGSVRGQVDLARLLLRTPGLAGGEYAAIAQEALDNLYLAENQDSGRAAFQLATLLAGSHGAYGTIADIRDYATAAFDLGVEQAAFLLAITYGAGRDADPAIAAAWLERGAAQNDWRSAYAYRLYQNDGLTLQQAIQAAAGATIESSAADNLARNARNTGVSPPQPVSMPAPVFPAGLGVMDVQGAVSVQFTVAPDGRTVGIQVLGSTHPQLGKAALEAVSKWTFKPGSRNGVAVPVTMKVPIIFAPGR